MAPGKASAMVDGIMNGDQLETATRKKKGKQAAGDDASSKGRRGPGRPRKLAPHPAAEQTPMDPGRTHP